MTRTATAFTVNRCRRLRWGHQLREKSRRRSLRGRRNVILPGQVFDGQAGLHQNHLRDYDPAVGRYSESDLIGLAGGSFSTYQYVGSNPTRWIDPSGLITLPNAGFVAGGRETHLTVIPMDDGPMEPTCSIFIAVVPVFQVGEVRNIGITMGTRNTPRRESNAPRRTIRPLHGRIPLPK
jgi:RHS repeat-associated protein